jgi:hypothetical protein
LSSAEITGFTKRARFFAYGLDLVRQLTERAAAPLKALIRIAMSRPFAIY